MEKFLLLTFLLTLTLAIPAHAVEVKSDAIISEDIPNQQDLANAAANMIRAHGWKCDSISVMRLWLFSRRFRVVRNNYSYSYELKDRGGNWEVTIDYPRPPAWGRLVCSSPFLACQLFPITC